MAEVFSGITGACEAYLCSIKEGRYYEAHEDLEGVWYHRRFEDDDEVRLWKGFINAAVCFELIKRGRIKPSERAWETYLKYRPLCERIETPRYSLYVTMIQSLEATHRVLYPENY